MQKSLVLGTLIMSLARYSFSFGHLIGNRRRIFSTILKESVWKHCYRSTVKGHLLSKNPSSGLTTTRLLSTSVDVDQEEIYQQLLRLSTEIRRHDEIYYLNGSATELSDDEYDALVEQEAKLCRENPLVLKRLEKESGLGKKATRFGGRVGPVLTPTSTDRFRKRKHLEKMYSLNNAHSVDEVLAWLGRIRKTLLKTYNSEENNMKIDVFTEPKLDGLSLSLRYARQPNDDGMWKFVLAATRGDGKEGQDVSIAVEQGLEVPLSFDWALKDETCTELEVRGEVILPESVFLSLSSENATFSNARNAASGIIMRSKQLEDDSEVRKLRTNLRFYAYGVATKKANGETLPDGMDLRDKLLRLGFRVPQPTSTTTLTLCNETEWTEKEIQPMLDYHSALQDYKQKDRTRPKSTVDLGFEDYGMDGCVHKISSESIRELLGHTPRAPRWAIAHKFAAETVVTKLLAVDLQVGRTGAITPVAKLEPVELNGVLIQRATLHNFGHMQQALGSDSIPVGSSVLIRRAGEVIPQVLRRVDDISDTMRTEFADKDMISLKLPENCPACGSPVILDQANNTLKSNAKVGTVGQVLRCNGPPLMCQPRAVSALAHAFSRDALDVTGVSQARIEKLMSLGFLRTPADLFVFAKNKTALEELTKVDGWGVKSVQNLADKVNSVAENGVSLTRFIYSLGIRYVGLQASHLIAAIYCDVNNFVDAIESAGKTDDPYADAFSLLREENEATKGIGPAVIGALVDFSIESEMVEAAVALSKHVKVHQQAPAHIGIENEIAGSELTIGPMAGLKIVFTGSIAGITRAKATAAAKSMGAKSVGSTVSKSTDVVVAGANGGKKLKDAERLGVRIISGDEFLEMLDAHIIEDNELEER